MKLLLELVPSKTIESAYSILGEEQTNKLLDGIADQRVAKIQNGEIEYELPNDEHPNYVYIYVNMED